MRRSATTQYRAVARGKDGGQVGGFDARRPMSDPIDAGMLALQHATAQSRLDLSPRHAGAKELLSGHHAVPAVGKTDQFLLNCPA
jgi:hypothetical protein